MTVTAEMHSSPSKELTRDRMRQFLGLIAEVEAGRLSVDEAVERLEAFPESRGEMWRRVFRAILG